MRCINAIILRLFTVYRCSTHFLFFRMPNSFLNSLSFTLLLSIEIKSVSCVCSFRSFTSEFSLESKFIIEIHFLTVLDTVSNYHILIPTINFELEKLPKRQTSRCDALTSMRILFGRIWKKISFSDERFDENLDKPVLKYET